MQKVKTGDKYNDWTVIEARSGKSLCRCKCGSEHLVINSNLVRGGSLRCMRCRSRKTNLARLGSKLVKGKKIGNWTILEIRLGRSICKCSCGEVKTVINSHLISKASTKCRYCSYKKPRGSRVSTGLDVLVHKKLRRAASDAVARCTNSSHRLYEWYGARGIKVHEPWVNNLTQFVNYLKRLRGHDNLKLWLDRVDNERNYEPGNLRFVTPKESASNRRLPS